MSIDFAIRCLLIAGVATAITACHRTARSVVAPATPVQAPAAPSTPPPPPAPPRVAVPDAPPRSLTDDEAFARQSLDALNASHPLADAFFDYDQTALRADARSALERDAQWLNRWRSTRVIVQGQCDERGSAEYNLALGDERAKTVKSYLTSLGVAENRIAVVSLGKESPVCGDDNEGCWSQNRRGHFVISAK